MNRPPRQMSPGQRALAHQLQSMVNRNPMEVPVYFGHDPIDTGMLDWHTLFVTYIISGIVLTIHD